MCFQGTLGETEEAFRLLPIETLNCTPGRLQAKSSWTLCKGTLRVVLGLSFAQGLAENSLKSLSHGCADLLLTCQASQSPSSIWLDAVSSETALSLLSRWNSFVSLSSERVLFLLGHLL